MHREARGAIGAFVASFLALGAPLILLWGVVELGFLKPLGVLLILAAASMDLCADFLGSRDRRHLGWASIRSRLLIQAVVAALLLLCLALGRWLL